MGESFGRDFSPNLIILCCRLAIFHHRKKRLVATDPLLWTFNNFQIHNDSERLLDGVLIHCFGTCWAVSCWSFFASLDWKESRKNQPDHEMSVVIKWTVQCLQQLSKQLQKFCRMLSLLLSLLGTWANISTVKRLEDSKVTTPKTNHLSPIIPIIDSLKIIGFCWESKGDSNFSWNAFLNSVRINYKFSKCWKQVYPKLTRF